MVLYEYILLEEKITERQCEVTETAKLFISSEGNFYSTYSNRIPKEKVGKVLGGVRGYRAIAAYISYEKNLDLAKKMFADWMRNVYIPSLALDVEKAQAKFNTGEGILSRLLCNNEKNEV